MEVLKLLFSPIGIVIVFIVCGTALALAIMGYRVQMSKEGAIIEKISGDKKRKTSPHATCRHRMGGVDAIRRTMEFTDRRDELRKSILEKQMDYYEEKEEEAKTLLKRAFGALLNRKYGIEDFSTNKAYNDFNKTLYITFGTIKKSVRKWFKNNHYDKLKPEDQIVYISTKKEIIIEKIREELTFNWFQEEITRKEFSEASRDGIDDFEIIISEVLSRAFTIAREVHVRIKLLEQNYCLFVKDTYGEDADILIGMDEDDEI